MKRLEDALQNKNSFYLLTNRRWKHRLIEEKTIKKTITKYQIVKHTYHRLKTYS